MAEAEAVLAVQCRPVGRMNSLRTSVVRRAVSRDSSGVSVWTAPDGRPRPRPRPPPARCARPASSWSRRASSSAWIVGGTGTSLVARLVEHRRHLLDEERVALRGLHDALRHGGVRRFRPQPARDQLLGLLRRRAARAAASRASPRGARELGPGHAERAGSARRPDEGDVLDQVEQCRLGPVESSNTSASGARARPTRRTCETPTRARPLRRRRFRRALLERRSRRVVEARRARLQLRERLDAPAST